MQTVLLTGANGFVGYYLIEQLIDREVTIIATGRGECRFPFSAPNLIYEPLHFTDAASVSKVFHQYKPHVVIHSGALSKPDECHADKEAAYTTNVTGTEFLLQQSLIYKSFFIFLSTDFVFDGVKGMYSEEDAVGPVNYYGETKVLAEEKVKQYPYAWSIVRTVLVYGAPQGAKDNLVSSVAKALQKGQTLHIYDDQVRTPTYVEDLASAIVTMVQRKATGIFHISGKDILTPYGIACAVADYLRLDKSLFNRVTRETFPMQAARPLITGFNLSKAKKELGYEPISFEEGLKKMFE